MAKTKKEIKVKEPVRIREKVLGDGTISLYLDMYHKGNRKKEGLKLYIIPETTPAAKLQNKNTRRLAEQVKAQRILDIQKDGLVDWEKLKKSRTTLVSWLEGFVTCEAQLSPSGVVSKRNAKVRVEELKVLVNTPCRFDIVKRAFLFSCFTGLRYSDMKSLLWSEIHTAADGKTLYIEHRQVKTKKTVTIPLSDEALRWMLKQQEGVDQVFHELKISTGTVEDVLKDWIKDCKIDKHITYHCSRHTAATLAISAGAELYSVSKILGHRDLVSTQVNAKVNLDKKIETVNLTKGVFD